MLGMSHGIEGLCRLKKITPSELINLVLAVHNKVVPKFVNRTPLASVTANSTGGKLYRLALLLGFASIRISINLAKSTSMGLKIAKIHFPVNRDSLGWFRSDNF